MNNDGGWTEMMKGGAKVPKPKARASQKRPRDCEHMQKLTTRSGRKGPGPLRKDMQANGYLEIAPKPKPVAKAQPKPKEEDPARIQHLIQAGMLPEGYGQVGHMQSMDKQMSHLRQQEREEEAARRQASKEQSR